MNSNISCKMCYTPSFFAQPNQASDMLKTTTPSCRELFELAAEYVP